tara:strand:+ start:131 stop:412 length:282 start_codon:yes stop_codon:yes gene_type:complete
MITKEEYLIALETVEQYHKQLNLQIFSCIGKKGKTKIKNWCIDNKIGGKLRGLHYLLPSIEFIEDVTAFDILGLKGFGESQLREFELYKKATL